MTSVPRDGAVAASDVLTRTVARLSTADSLEQITAIVASGVRRLLGAEGATFVLREDGHCFYADEDAIAPLWKGNRFPLETCVSGWAMLHREVVVIPDIYDDPRVPVDAYRPTFVKSLCMAPIRPAQPIGALGAYWSSEHRATPAERRQLQVLANSTAVALENLELRGAVARRSDERDGLAARTEELEAAIHTLVHDLRSPLGAMMGYAELIAEGDLDPEKQQAFARTITDTGQRMSAQIDQMLGLYRVTNRQPDPRPVDLSALAREVADQELARVGAGDRIVRIDVAEGLAAVADPLLARMVLENLVGNAVKYTGKVPEAVITVARGEQAPDGMVAVVVRDNGAGFDTGEATRLFRPLSRLHTDAEFAGTGLGLASVARILELHGGTITAEGVRGEGAAFTFTLPAG